jgi:hypothetical protein
MRRHPQAHCGIGLREWMLSGMTVRWHRIPARSISITSNAKQYDTEPQHNRPFAS